MPPVTQPNTVAEQELRFTPRLFALAALCGAATGAAASALMALLRFVQHIGFGWTRNIDFEQAVTDVTGRRRLLCLLIASLIVALAFWLKRGLVIGDSGVTKAVWLRDGLMSARATAFDAVESILIVGLGVSLGREAALKEAGGALASQLALRLGLQPNERKVLVAIAAGAGMAAAYNLPLGGALLAAEVFLGTLSLPVLLLAITASSAGTAVSWLTLPLQATYRTPVYSVHPRDIVWAVLAGPLLGLFATLWVRSVAWARAHRVKGAWSYAVPLLVFTALGLAAIRLPGLLGNGKGLVQLALVGDGTFRALLLLSVLKLVFTAACVGSGAPGGLFTPTMALGALAGSVLGRLWSMVLPGSDVGGYAMIGAATMLAASTAGPLSSFVMVMELTHHAEALVVPVAIATVGAALVQRWISRSRTPASIYTV